MTRRRTPNNPKLVRSSVIVTNVGLDEEVVKREMIEKGRLKLSELFRVKIGTMPLQDEPVQK